MIVRNINWTKISGVIIIGICLISMLIGRLVQPYRGTWIFGLGSMIGFIGVLEGIFLSFVNTLFLILKLKTKLKKNLIWILLSAFPLLYFGLTIMIKIIKI